MSDHSPPAARPAPCQAGSGLLANKFAARHAVVHTVDGLSFLSVYDDAAYSTMKGSRLQLDARASVTVEGEVFYVVAHDEKTSVAQETITQSYTSVAVTAKFKAASEEEAATWVAHIQAAINGH